MPDMDFIGQLLKSVPWLASVIGTIVAFAIGWKWVGDPVYDKVTARSREKALEIERLEGIKHTRRKEAAALRAERDKGRRAEEKELEQIRGANYLQLDRVTQTAVTSLREFSQERQELKAEQLAFLYALREGIDWPVKKAG